MALFTKCILHDRQPEDGIRISVMSRHKLSDGKTNDERITQDKFDEHIQEFGPPPKLIGDYYKRGLSWEQFEQRYLKHIRSSAISSKVRTLAGRSLSEDITILCIEDNPQYCHRRLLAEECVRLFPNLIIEHH